MCTEHTQTPSQPHTDGKVLSQHPQIRLHVTFPIRGFLERLNPRVLWYSSLQSRAQVDIPVHGLWALISRRICNADPRFPQDQRPSCEHGNDSQLQMWHTHASLCTHSHMRPVSLTRTHTRIATWLSRIGFLQAEVIKVKWTNPLWNQVCAKNIKQK